MLKFSSAISNEDGLNSPTHKDLEYTRNKIELSAGSKHKMAIKRKGTTKRFIPRDSRAQDGSILPPISHSNSPMAVSMPNIVTGEKRDTYSSQNQQPFSRRKEVRTPYISHAGMNRTTDVTTPYVLHTQITNIDSSNFVRENSKLSGNVVELKHEPGGLNHESTFSSLQKIPSGGSPLNDKRPRGRHGRNKSSSFNENDIIGRNGDIRELTIQSNQMGLYKRADRRQRDPTKSKGDESFSIRKKIEQFRRWHEEQYKDKIKKLKQEVDHQFEKEHSKITRQVGAQRETPTSKNEMSIPGDVEKNELVPSEKSHEKMDEDKATPNLSHTNDTSKPRTESARTWHTWRQVNDSYAYNDVQRYIKDNELMDDEKSMWIKKWIIEVNKSMKDVHHETIL